MSAVVAAGAVASVVCADKHPNESTATHPGSLHGTLFRVLMASLILALHIAYLSELEIEAPQQLHQPSPTTQGCTPEGGVSAYCADDNSKGGAHE